MRLIVRSKLTDALLCTLEGLAPTDTVRTLQSHIWSHDDTLPPERQRLYYTDTCLHDTTKTLANYGITDKATVTLLCWLRGTKGHYFGNAFFVFMSEYRWFVQQCVEAALKVCGDIPQRCVLNQCIKAYDAGQPVPLAHLVHPYRGLGLLMTRSEAGIFARKEVCDVFHFFQHIRYAISSWLSQRVARKHALVRGFLHLFARAHVAKMGVRPPEY